MTDSTENTTPCSIFGCSIFKVRVSPSHGGWHPLKVGHTLTKNLTLKVFGCSKWGCHPHFQSEGVTLKTLHHIEKVRVFGTNWDKNICSILNLYHVCGACTLPYLYWACTARRSCSRGAWSHDSFTTHAPFISAPFTWVSLINGSTLHSLINGIYKWHSECHL